MSSTRNVKNADINELEHIVSLDSCVRTEFYEYGTNSSFFEYSYSNEVKFSRLLTEVADYLTLAVEWLSPRISTPGT